MNLDKRNQVYKQVLDPVFSKNGIRWQIWHQVYEPLYDQVADQAMKQVKAAKNESI